MKNTPKSILEPEQRSALIRQMMAERVTREYANMIADLAEHAERQAMEAFVRVCESAPKEVSLQVLSLGVALLNARIEKESLALLGFATVMGFKILTDPKPVDVKEGE